MSLMLVVDVALIIVAGSIVMCFYRVIVGPSMPDRILALDTIAIAIIAMVSLYSIKLGTKFLLDAGLVIAIIGFFSVVLASKFLQRGDIIDRD